MRYAVIVKQTREVSSIHQMEGGSRPVVRSADMEAVAIAPEVRVGDFLPAPAAHLPAASLETKSSGSGQTPPPAKPAADKGKAATAA